MPNWTKALAVLALVAACDGNPWAEETEEPLPPGTTDPTASSPITRTEEVDDSGNGFAEGMSYDATTDTFTVDGLAFDGDNVYTRDTAVPSLGPFAVYEAASVFNDPLTGQPIQQFQHKAIYGVDPEGDVSFAIVRTGAYVPYGYGGWIYSRSGGVELPTTGQASYAGNYAALRDFDGRGGLEYATGSMNIAIDFADFNDGNGVQGQVYNRKILDTDGNDITDTVIAALNAEYDASATSLPVMNFKVGPGVTTAAGELSGGIDSYVVDNDGNLTQLEDGKYYAVLSGNNAGKVVGVIVVESDDPRFDATVRETGGFILVRE